MDIEDILPGFLVCIVLLMVVAAAIAFTEVSIKKQCDTIGAFEASGVVYECKKKEVSK